MSKEKPRKRSSRQSKEVREESILKAARQVFEERGYENAKVPEIAEIVGVVEGTVFHYFGSKRALVLKVMERFYQEITKDLRERITGIQGTRNRLHYIIWHHLNVINNNAALCGVILRESRGLNKAFSKDVQRLNRNYTNSLNQVIKEGIDAGEISPETSPLLMRNTIYGSIENALWHLLSDGQKINVDKSAQQLTSLVFQGISASPTELNKSEVSLLVHKLNLLLNK